MFRTMFPLSVSWIRNALYGEAAELKAEKQLSRAPHQEIQDKNGHSCTAVPPVKTYPDLERPECQVDLRIWPV